MRSGYHASGGQHEANCRGNCDGCSRAAPNQAGRAPTNSVTQLTKETARQGLRRLQSVTGALLLLSSVMGTFLLATDKSLWLLAVSHAVGLIMIIILDVVLGLYSLASAKSAYLPSIAAGFLGFLLQLGDVFTAPQ